MSEPRPRDNPPDQRRVATPSTESSPNCAESEDDWDVDEELEAEQFGGVLDMSNVLAVRALLNHMHVCLMNGDLAKTETLIQKAYHFLDQVEDKSIGVRIDEIRQQVERHRRGEQQPMVQAGWLDTPVCSRLSHIHGQNDDDAYPDPVAAEEDTLFKYLAEDTRKVASPAVPAEYDSDGGDGQSLLTQGTKPQPLLHINPGSIDDYYRRYHQDIPYSANVKACYRCMPGEKCYCGIDDDDFESTSTSTSTATPAWMRANFSPLSCSIDFVDPWKGPLHRNSDTALLHLKPSNISDNSLLSSRAKSAPRITTTTNSSSTTIGPPLPSPPPAPPTHLLHKSVYLSLTRRRSSNISPKTQTCHQVLPSPRLQLRQRGSTSTSSTSTSKEGEGIAPEATDGPALPKLFLSRQSFNSNQSTAGRGTMVRSPLRQSFSVDDDDDDEGEEEDADEDDGDVEIGTASQGGLYYARRQSRSPIHASRATDLAARRW